MHRHPHLKPIALIVVLALAACEAPPPDEGPHEGIPASPPLSRSDSTELQQDSAQVSQYVRCMFQDRDGHLWFGTTTDGVVRYDGSSLAYFNATNGFGSDWVNAIVQDMQGDLWFATRDGVVRFDGNRFTRYTTKDGLPSDHCWSLLADRDGSLWAGTYEGAARMRTDGYGHADRRFVPFAIPAADLSAHPYEEDPKLIHAIAQDKSGDIWFATKGGAYRYNGSQLTRFAEPEGLCNNFVNTIHQQRDGRLLFGTRFGGVCAYDGHAFTPVLRNALHGDNVGLLHEDRSGTLWAGLTAVGVCNAAGSTVTCYNQQDGEGIRVVFCMLEDDQGRMWIGTGAGLYRYEASTSLSAGAGHFVNVTKGYLMRMPDTVP